ncbi:MAG: GNAT family N-acetyltransferase [Prevotellaceae bacterium]|jgi:RimJ/RimL family protein N-acetyltransferase|nr:GNAT family N-acetyltransferase [Prevotellaceae bacterium]
MKFQIRNTLANDIAIYKKCIESNEFRWNLYGNNIVKTEECILYKEEQHKKFIVSKINTDTIEDIGFCDFYFNREIKEYIYSGGILAKFFNSGIGLYANIAVLSYMFTVDTNTVIKVYIYKYNQRSLKMAIAIGFQFYGETEDENILKLTVSKFNNQFVNKILKRLEISVILP